MMKKIINIILLIFILSCFCVCSSSQTTTNLVDSSGGLSVGTMVPNPKQPSEVIKNIFPEFEEALPGLSQIGRISYKQIDYSDPDNDTVTNRLLDKIFSVNDVKEFDVVLMFHSLKELGVLIQETLDENKVTFPLAEEMEMALTEGAHLLSLEKKNWILHMMTELNDSEYVRIYFIDPDDQMIEGSYVFKTDGQGNAVKGMLGIIFPDALTSEYTLQTRVVILTYDFTDQSKHLFNVRMDRKLKEKRIMAGQVLVQCNLDTSGCIAEHQSIISKPPVREFSDYMPRYQWNANDQTVCFAEVAYESGQVDIDHVMLYDGNTKTVVENTCSLETPIWNEHVFTTDDLFIRVEDAALSETTFGGVQGDGLSHDSWMNYVGPAFIDDTLNGSDQKN